MRSVCPLFGIRRLCAIREQKCTASTGIAVGTSTVVRYSEEVRYWEGPLSEVPLYIYYDENKDGVVESVYILPCRVRRSVKYRGNFLMRWLT